MSAPAAMQGYAEDGMAAAVRGGTAMSEPELRAVVPEELLPAEGITLSRAGSGGVARGDRRAAEGIA